MSTIQKQSTLVHADSGLAAASVIQRSSVESAFASSSISVTTTPESITAPGDNPLGDVVVPRDVFLKLTLGDDVLVSVDAGTNYPLSLSGEGDCMTLSMDSRTTSAITCVADVAGSLGGKYFIIHDLAGPVWVWFDTGAGVAATDTVTYGAPSNGDTLVVNGTTFTKAAAGSPTEFSTIGELTALIEGLANISSGDNGTVITITADTVGLAGNAYTLSKTGSALTLSGATFSGGIGAGVEPTPTTERLLPVTITVGATANAVADAVAAALDADASFICANPAAATLSIVDAGQGSRTTITAGTSGFTSPSASSSTPPVIYVKSLSSSQMVVAVAPA